MKSITLNKKQYPVVFNMAALLELEELCDITIAEFLTSLENIPPGRYLKMLFVSLKYGAEKAGKKFTLKYGEFVDLITNDQAAQEELSKIVNEDFKILMELQAEKMKLHDQGEAGDEKKTIASGPTTSDVSGA